MKKILIIIFLSLFLISCKSPSKKQALESYNNSLQNYELQTNGNYRVEITYITNKIVEKQIYIMKKDNDYYETTVNIQNYLTSSTNIQKYELKDNNLYQNDNLLDENYSKEDFITNYTKPLYLKFDKSLSDYSFTYTSIIDSGYNYNHTYSEKGCTLNLLGEVIRDIEEKVVSVNDTLISYNASLYNYQDTLITFKSNYINK